MFERSLVRLFARPGAILAIASKDGKVTEAPRPGCPTLTTEELLRRLQFPGERPVVVFPVLSPEIEAVLPKDGSFPGANPIAGERP